MKTIFVIAFMLFAFAGRTQITGATLQATGLTCAMCSNAVNKSLLKVSFIESVRSDIKNSSFAIRFKSDAEVNIDAIKEAVEEAGFSVGSLKITLTLNDVQVGADGHTRIGNTNYHILDAQGQTLNGERTITVVDKDFISVKQFKKISSASKHHCVLTGKTEECCTKSGMTAGNRIYHVTI